MSNLDALKAKFAEADFIADDTIAIAIDLVMKLSRPLLLEGAAGDGKTEAAALEREKLREAFPEFAPPQ